MRRQFTGVRQADGRCRVYLDDVDNPSAPRQRLRPRRGRDSHAPTGFEWGSGGSGPAELARALVVVVTGEMAPSPRLYQTLKARLVQMLPEAGWVLDEEVVRRHVGVIIREITEEAAHGEAT